MLRPEARAQPWGVRVMDFNTGQFRGELAWLDALEADAQDGGT
jgi:hypothetical protein